MMHIICIQYVYTYKDIYNTGQMQKTLKIVLPILAITFLLFIVNNPQFSQTSSLLSYSQSQKQGNLTTQMIQTLKGLIDNSTELYRRYRLVDMANYISNGMKKNFGDQWQVFVFGESTEHCSFNANTIFLNHWAIWEQYGLYDLCYVVYRTKSCLKNEPKNLQQSPQTNLSPSYQQQWGPSFNDAEKERILVLFDQANSYGGANMTANAEYIIQKIGTGGWGVAIAGPSNGVGMSSCYFRGYYAYLVDYTQLLWTFALIREY